MKATLLIFTILFISLNVQSQNKVLELDGVNDYVNLGNTAGNNLRTIEFWFKPATNISSSLTSYKTMIGRNTGPLGAGDHFEFGIFFSNLFGNRGKIAFSINNNRSNNYTIYSNSNQWNSNQWYHLAAVMDPNSGTKLFIDGVLQNQTSTYTGSTDTSRFYTAIGRYGDFSRYFDGKIDNVKFHSTAVYTANFTPSCNSAIGDFGTWNFDGNTAAIATDASPSNNDGAMINGATKMIETVCPVTVGIEDKKLTNNSIESIYPNPVQNILNISIPTIQNALPYQLMNMLGQPVQEGRLNKQLSSINLGDLNNGIYFLRVWKQGEIEGVYKIIKK